MEDIISKVIEAGLGNVIDKRRDPLLLQDEVYQKDISDLTEIEEKYMKLDLPKQSQMIVEDYIACAETAHCRANDLCYMAGIRDTVLFFNQVGLLKENNSKENFHEAH